MYKMKYSPPNITKRHHENILIASNIYRICQISTMEYWTELRDLFFASVWFIKGASQMGHSDEDSVSRGQVPSPPHFPGPGYKEDSVARRLDNCEFNFSWSLCIPEVGSWFGLFILYIHINTLKKENLWAVSQIHVKLRLEEVLVDLFSFLQS
jgi:hypothetical protein